MKYKANSSVKDRILERVVERFEKEGKMWTSSPGEGKGGWSREDQHEGLQWPQRAVMVSVLHHRDAGPE